MAIIKNPTITILGGEPPVPPVKPRVAQALKSGYKLFFVCDKEEHLPGEEFIDPEGETHNIEIVDKVVGDNKDEQYPWTFNIQDIDSITFCPSFIYFEPESVCGWFSGFSYLTEVKGWEWLNTSKCIDMSYMFKDCETNLREIDMSKVDMSRVQFMSSMFENCRSVEEIVLGSRNTTQFTALERTDRMFYYCEYLATIKCDKDMSALDTITDDTDMFYECTQLPNFSRWETDKSHANTQSGAGYFTQYDNLRWMKALYDADNEMLLFVDNPTEYEVGQEYRIGDWTFTLAQLFDVPASVEIKDEVPWKDLSIKCVSFEDSSMRTSELFSTAYWFDGHAELEQVYGDRYMPTKLVINAKFMYNGCTSLHGDYYWDVDAPRLVDAESCFAGTQITGLWLIAWTNKVIRITKDMFSGCRELGTIYVNRNEWQNDSMEESERMFSNCFSLTNFDDNYRDASRAYVGDGGYMSGV